MSFFRIIIPTFNGAEHLPRMVASIRSQTCQDYHMIIVDDVSTDDTWPTVMKLEPDKAVRLTEKGFQGGARNTGTDYFKDDLYTFFLDDDDQLVDDLVLERIKRTAEENGLPDLIQLNYCKTICHVRMEHKDRYPYQPTPQNICMSAPVAPWTKVVKSALVVPFPLGLINGEDVLQHIRQCDICETAAIVQEDCVNWIIRPNSASQDHQNPLWQMSWYLEGYTLMQNLNSFNHDWAKARVERRLAQIDRQIAKGVR